MSIAQPAAGGSSADLSSNNGVTNAPLDGAPNRPSDIAPAGTTAANERETFQLHLGYQRVKPELDALNVNDLLQINLDVPAAVQIGLGAATEAAPYESQLQALSAAGFKMNEALQLRDRALALGHTHLEFATATGTPDAGLVQALFKGRTRLAAYAAPLVEDGYFTEAAVAAHRSGFSHRDVAYNVIGLAGLFLKHWDQVQSVVNLKRQEIEDLRARANDVLLVLSAQEQDPDGASAWALERQKAFTLFMRSFTEMRHGIAFLRRTEGDLNEIIPSLYPKKRRRREGAVRDNGSPQASAGDSTDAEDDAATDDALIEAPGGVAPAARIASKQVAAGYGGQAAVGQGGLAAVAHSGQAAEPPPPAIAIGLPGSPPTFGDEP